MAQTLASMNAVTQSLAAKLTGNGLGEKEDFLTTENHLFINKLNYICKNYDKSFADVSTHFHG